MATEKEDLEDDITKHSSELEVAETSSRDQILQCTVEQVLDVFVREMAVPKTVSQDRIQH